MSHKSSRFLLNTLALEMKTALALAAQGNLSKADKRMANIRFNRAVDQARKLGYFPKFLELPNGGIRVIYQTLEKAAEENMEHQYQHGDIDDRDFCEPSPFQRCSHCGLLHCKPQCPRCEQRLRQAYDAGHAKHGGCSYERQPDHVLQLCEECGIERTTLDLRTQASGNRCPGCRKITRYKAVVNHDPNFYRPHVLNPFTKRGRERVWLLDPKVDVIIYEDGEVLIDTHDANKTRVRERLHNKENRQ